MMKVEQKPTHCRSLSQLLLDLEEKIHREKIKSEWMDSILSDLTEAHELVGTDFEK